MMLFGKYQYKNLLMGYATSQDIFTDQFGRAVDHIIEGIQANEDFPVYGFEQKQFRDHCVKIFKACNKSRVTLNINKIQI
jgi:hypothetical protein